MLCGIDRYYSCNDFYIQLYEYIVFSVVVGAGRRSSSVGAAASASVSIRRTFCTVRHTSMATPLDLETAADAWLKEMTEGRAEQARPTTPQSAPPTTHRRTTNDATLRDSPHENQQYYRRHSHGNTYVTTAAESRDERLGEMRQRASTLSSVGAWSPIPGGPDHPSHSRTASTEAYEVESLFDAEPSKLMRRVRQSARAREQARSRQKASTNTSRVPPDQRGIKDSDPEEDDGDYSSDDDAVDDGTDDDNVFDTMLPFVMVIVIVVAVFGVWFALFGGVLKQFIKSP